VKTIAVSDVHLGTEKSNETAFNEFLGSLHDDKELTDLVLLGDILDMWHRDASGIFLENMDTIRILRSLQSKIRVHWVAGNHDYHLLRLKNRAPHYHYPFEFQETLELKDGAHTYRFMHGYEFEYGSELEFMKPIMEVYCHVMSDSLLMIAGNFHAKPQERLKDLLVDIQKRAYEVVRDKPSQILVFGHTHQPFINREENVVNSGSWVMDESPNNTYVELVGGEPRLFTFGGKEIKSRKVIA
jgi:UDP-2,3-diacylglucosamine pyrophosphatase LpxH